MKVRISKDNSKDYKWAVEILKEDKWVVERRFKNRSRCQNLIDHGYRNSDQLKDYKYDEVNNGKN